MPAHRRTLPPPELAAYRPQPSETRRLLRADLCCYLCGGICGELEAEPARTLPSVVQFRAIGSQHRQSVAWRGLRCPRCGGPTYVDNLETVRLREEQVNWLLDAPRRGRPPRWLVEMRAQDAA